MQTQTAFHQGSALHEFRRNVLTVTFADRFLTVRGPLWVWETAGWTPNLLYTVLQLCC